MQQHVASADVVPVLAPASDSNIAGARVLVIDDDIHQIEVLTLRLHQQGLKTLSAQSGRDGLAAAKQEQPDLIVLDLCLPDVSGFLVCETLTDDPATAAIPIVILSGMERPDIIRRSRAAGCSYYVRKPYDPNALLLIIEHAIRETQQW